MSTQASQIMLFEYLLHLGVEVCFTILILQLHLDVAPELIVLGEYRYHRHLKKSFVSTLVHKVCMSTRHTILIRANLVKML